MSPPTSLGLLLACTALATAALAPVAYWVMSARSVLDVPNHRSSHEQPTVRGGGVACLSAMVLVWAGASIAGMAMPHAALAAVTVLSLVGLADDVRGLPPVARLLAQLAVGVALGAWLGGMDGMLLGALAFPVAVNAVNFMDGINGITALTVSAWAGVALLAGPGVADPISLLAALSLGLAVGFLPWNAPRARMFLGDTGSYLFGGLVATSILESLETDASPWVLVAPMALYLTDTGYTLLRRARARRPLLEAHREHLYQRLQAATGLSHISVALLVAGGAFTCGFAVRLDSAWGTVGTTLICAGYLLVVHHLDRRKVGAGHV